MLENAFAAWILQTLAVSVNFESLVNATFPPPVPETLELLMLFSERCHQFQV